MSSLNIDKNNSDNFYVVAYEPGAQHPKLPTWASNVANPFGLSADKMAIERRDISGVPGAFQLLNVLTPQECQRLINATESLGYLPDAPVSLPRDVRHNDNLTMVVDQATDALIWQRVSSLFSQGVDHFNGLKPLGINARFRFYRYQEGDYFKRHIDGSWPGSRVINDKLITQAYDDRWSQMTFLMLLNDDFKGGETRFWVDKNDSTKPARHDKDANVVDIRTPQGGVLVFPHGHHPMHCLHGSEPITKGTKYIIRTDVLFDMP